MRQVIFFDIDNTLTEDNSWERLNQVAGMTPEEDYELYKKFHNSEITYAEWTNQLQRYYRQRKLLTQRVAVNALVDYKVREEALSTMTSLRAQGYTTVLLTGGFRTTAEHLAEELGADDYLYVTDITYHTNGDFDKLISKGEEGEAKLSLAGKYCRALGYDLSKAIAVGDSSNDIPLFQSVARSFTFSWSKAEVKNAASDIIENLAGIPDMLKSGGNI